jgi:hypothetical protein
VSRTLLFKTKVIAFYGLPVHNKLIISRRKLLGKVGKDVIRRKLPLEVPNEVFLFFLLTLFMLSHVVVVLCSSCPFALVVPFVKWYYFQVVPCSLIPVFRRSHVLVIL